MIYPKRRLFTITLLMGLMTLILSGCHHHPDQSEAGNQTMHQSDASQIQHPEAAHDDNLQKSTGKITSSQNHITQPNTDNLKASPKGAATKSNVSHTPHSQISSNQASAETPSSEAPPAYKHVSSSKYSNEKQNHSDERVRQTVDKNARAAVSTNTSHSTRERQGYEHPVRASDCTASHWTRVSCKNNDNVCIAHQIDLMGQYERCRKAGLLEHH